MTNLAKNKKVQMIDINDILLDSNNPRFLEKDNNASQDDLLGRLNNSFDPLSVAESIVKNGYSQSEPVVTYTSDDGKSFVVGEGNRRVAALKIMLNDNFRALLKKNKKEWDKLAELFQKAYGKNVKIPAVNYDSRSEILPIVSQSHINGKLPWGASEQARFISDLTDKENKSFEEVSELTGIKISEVKEKYASIKVCEELSAIGIETDRIYNRLTILQNSMANKEVRARLQIKPSSKIIKGASLLLDNYSVDDLKETLIWIFGSKLKKEIVADSRNIIKFAQVISSELGLGLLRSGESLDSAIKAINENGTSPKKITYNVLSSISTQLATLKNNYSLLDENDQKEVNEKMLEMKIEFESIGISEAI